MQIRSRLAMSYGVLLLFIVATLVVAVVRFDQLSRQVDGLVNHDAALVELAGVINLNAESVASRLLLLFILEDREQRMVLYRDMDSRNREIDEAVDRLQMLIPEQQKVISELQQLRETYQSKLQSTVESLEMGQRSKARQMMAEETRTSLDQLLSFTDSLAAQQRTNMQVRQQQTLNIAEQSVYVMLLLGAGAVVLGVFMSVLITRSITRPLNRAVAAADRIATGDLSVEVPKGKADELGVLLNSMANMREHLLGVIGRVSSVCDSADSKCY